MKKIVQAFGSLKEDSFNFEQIERYFRKKDHKGTFQSLSDKTCNDLDFNELFMFIDRTNSKVGQQFIYNQLRTIPSDSSTTERNEKLIKAFTHDRGFREKTQTLLSRLNQSEALYITSLFQEEHLNPPQWFFIVRLLSFTVWISLFLLIFNPVMAFVLLPVFIINMALHYWNKKNLYQYLSSLPQLLKLKAVATELFKEDLLKEINPQLPESIRIVNKVRNRMIFFQMEAKLQGDLQALTWGIMELFKIMFLLEPLLLFGVLRRLDTKRKEIEEIYTFVGEIDALISIASLRIGLETSCRPQMLEKKGLVVQEVYHPLIIDCVRNSISVNDHSILLTGSNMSGKTSFIRTIALNVITGLTLNTCFASQVSLSRMRVFSAIRISDDLLNDKSYYFEEVLTIKEMIDQSATGIPNLFLLDEIFKGTNTVERISAGKAVLSALTKAENIVFVSTHDIELADLLKEEYELYHFSEQVDAKTVDFDYKLKEGKLKTRNAIRILQINDYPESIINEAIEIAKEMDKGRLPGLKRQGLENL